MKISIVKFVIGYLLFCLCWLILTRGFIILFNRQISPEIIKLIVFCRPFCFVLAGGLLIIKLIKTNNKIIELREADYQKMYLGNPNPMWIYDPVSFRFLLVNKAAVETYGYSEKEFLAMSVKDIHPVEDNIKPDLYNPTTDHYFASGIWRQIKKDKTEIYVNIISHKIIFNQKNAVVVLAADTTGQVKHEQQLKQMNNALLEERQKLKETEKLARVSGWEFFMESGELIWTDELYQIFDLDPAEKITKERVLQGVYPDDLELYNQAVENLFLLGRDLDIEHRYITGKGEIRYVKVLGKMHYQNNKMFKVLGTMQDLTELKLVQIEKNKYSNLFKNTLANINDGYCSINCNWIFTEANVNCENLLHYSREQMIGRHYNDLFPGKENSKFYTYLKKVLEEGVFLQFEEFFPKNQKWLCVNAYPTDDGLAVYFSDITGIKQKDLLLKEALERYDLVAKATHDVIYDYDVRRRSIEYSDNIMELLHLGENPNRQNVDWWKSRIHDDDLTSVVRGYQFAIHQKKENYGLEYRVKTNDHQYKYVYDQGYLQFNANGKFMRMIGAIKDIDQLKRFDGENKRLAEIITKVNNMIVIQDVDNKISWVNKAFENCTGYTLCEVAGKYPQEILFGPETDLSIGKSILDAKNKQENFSYEIINYNKNGKKYWVNIEFTPVFTPDGKPDGYISIHTDITARKEKAEKISRQNKILKNIAWMSSHELRRPVASILGLINLINETEDETERNEAISMMNTCTQHLDEIIHNINHKIEQEITEK